MSEDGSGPPTGRARIGWWLFIVALGVVAAYVGYSFIGILLLGIFGYYATRPINRRLAAVIDSDERAAWATVVLVLLPLIAVLFYAGFRIFSQVQQALGDADFAYGEPLATLPDEQRDMLQSALQNPTQLLSNPMDILQTVEPVASTIIGITFLVSLAVTLTAFLHTNDHALSAGLRHLFGGRDTTAYAYAATLDEDFASAFFGNFLFVLAMVVVSTLVYWGTNLLAPADLHVPLLFVLGFLTGVASLIPMVTGKLVFVPVVGYLAFQAIRSDGTSLVFVGVVLVVYVILLDFLPQTFLQPYLSGRHLDTVMMMFGYLLGPALFGWYGFFLLPMVFIAIIEALRIVVLNLLHGEPLSSAVEMGDDAGTTPRSEHDAVPEDGSPSENDGPTPDDRSAQSP